MNTLGDIKLNPLRRVLVYGKSKVGKTFGAGSWPRPNFMDFDRGTATLMSKAFIEQYGWHPEIPIGRFQEGTRTTGGVVTTHKAFDAACKWFDDWMTPAKRTQFDTWIVDTATTLAEAAMNKGVILLGGNTFGSKPLSSSHEQAIRSGLLIPRIQDYGAERSMVEQFIRMVLDSDKHVVVLCHEKEVSDDKGSVIQRVPLLTGQSAERVPLMFDEVYRLVAVPDGPGLKRKLTTQANGVNLAGSRSGIPDGTEWSWPALEAQFKVVNEQVTKLTTKGT